MTARAGSASLETKQARPTQKLVPDCGGAGWVVFRDTAELPEDLIFHVNYLGGDMPVFQISFSRPAAGGTLSASGRQGD